MRKKIHRCLKNAGVASKEYALGVETPIIAILLQLFHNYLSISQLFHDHLTISQLFLKYFVTTLQLLRN